MSSQSAFSVEFKAINNNHVISACVLHLANLIKNKLLD